MMRREVRHFYVTDIEFALALSDRMATQPKNDTPGFDVTQVRPNGIVFATPYGDELHVLADGLDDKTMWSKTEETYL